MKLPQSKRWLVYAGVALILGLFFVLTTEVRELTEEPDDDIAAVDKFILNKAFQLRGPYLNQAAVDITALGSASVLTLFTVVFSALMLTLRRPWLAANLIIAALGGLLWSETLKRIVERERPPLLSRLVEARGFSYPSGHSFSSAAFYLTLAILACRIFPAKKHRALIFSLSGGVIFLVGGSRVFLGVHYPSDVLGGVMLGVSWALLVAVVLSHWKTSVKT